MKLLKQQLWRENPESILAEHIENHTIVSIIDVIGRIIYANNKFCELIEIPHERIQGELNVILKSERHANPIYKDLWTVIKSGEIWKGTLSDYTNSGKFYRLDTTIIPTRNENGEIDKFVVYFYDAQPKNKPKLKIVDGEKEAKTYYDILSNSVLTINMFAEILNSTKGSEI